MPTADDLENGTKVAESDFMTRPDTKLPAGFAALQDEYATLKKQLAATINTGDAAAREAYANSKTQFIQRVVQIAISAGYPHRP